MTKREDRDTYLPERKILGRVIDTSDKISRFLADLRQGVDDQRTHLLLDTLIDLQNQLTARIAEYRSRAPWQVSNTFVQYVDPGSGKIDDMIAEQHELISVEEITAAAVALNNELIRELENVSINEGVPESREAFDNLQSLIGDTCRKMSMDASMSRDV